MTTKTRTRKVIWSEALELGIAQIDSEHQEWIRLVNQFCQAVEDGRASDVLYEALADALHYTETHLRSEEAFMVTHGYPYLDDHRGQHAVASEEMHKFTTGHYNEEYLIAYFTTFLPNWLEYHINTSDRKMAEWVLEKEIAVSAE